ncbi:MAG: hypothetical protein FWF90_16210 [Promicromonosporaceae bacterium]|nr:hypothetical protein [Promicromonosporaceae bacterium]
MRIRAALAGVAIVAGLGLAGCSSAEAPPPSPTTVAHSQVQLLGPQSYTVWKAVMVNWPTGIPSDVPLSSVTKVEDHTDGTIRVYSSDRLTKPAAVDLGTFVFRFGAFDNTALTTVIVQDAQGLDTNIFRSDVAGIQH